MQEGDVFTVWTYADAVLTREFPLNAWTAELNIALANRTYEHLAARKFAGKSNLRPVFAELGQALAISTNLTIILISDGTDVVVGTPFDRPINVTYGKRASELRTAKMPFTTALVTQNGEFTHWSVRGGVEDINLPMPVRNPFPGPAPVLAAVPPQPPPAPDPGIRPTAPAIVVPLPAPATTGVSPTNSIPPRPVPAATPVPAPEPIRPPPVAPSTNGPADPVPAVKPVDVPAPKPAIVATPPPKPVTNTVAAVSPVPKAPAPPAPIKPPAPAPPPPKETPASPLPKPVPSPVPSPPAATKATSPPLPPPPTAAVTNVSKMAAAISPPKPAIVPEQKPASAPVIKPKETLVLPAIPPVPQPVIPPALRQPKSLIETSNTLAKVELLRPPGVVSTSAAPAQPLQARVSESKLAPVPTTNTPRSAVPTQPQSPAPLPSARPLTNAAVIPPMQPKAVALLTPPIPAVAPAAHAAKQPGNTSSNASVRSPGPETVSTVPTNAPTPKDITSRLVTTQAVTTAAPPSVPAVGTGKGQSGVATNTSVTPRTNAPSKAASQPVASAAGKASPATNQPAKPKAALAVASPRAQSGGWVYLGAAVILLCLAGGVIAYLLRPQPQPSVISQSMKDHPESPRE